MAGQIPPKFVWTKMSTDAGEPLENIVCRKELERRSGKGEFKNVFWWGVGESRGEAIRKHLVGKGKKPKVLFSRMPSRPKKKAEEGGLIWQSYLDDEGIEQPIPGHVIVHSRPTETHHAIVCRSPKPLKLPERDSESQNLNKFYKSELRNLNKDGGKGDEPDNRQTTSVVCHCPNSKERTVPSYYDDLRADLVDPYFVKLASPRPLTETEHALFRALDLRIFLHKNFACLTETERALFRALFQCIGEDDKTIDKMIKDYLSVVGELRKLTES